MKTMVGAVWMLHDDGRRTLMCVATPQVADQWFYEFTRVGHRMEVTAENLFNELTDVPRLTGPTVGDLTDRN